MSSKKTAKKKTSSKGTSTSGASTPPPQFIMDDVKFLFSNLTNPESQVQFNPPQRANPSTIQSNIGPPMVITWTWADEAARKDLTVTQDDIGKFGRQTDTNMAFRLGSIGPVVWQAVQPSASIAWNWLNVVARTNQAVTADDLGKIGLQTDINTLFQLTSLPTGAAAAGWQQVPNPNNTSSPFELSTGASDADSYHDFYRLQIAFEDVWAELLDSRIETTGKQLYAQWDALMDSSNDDSGETDRQKVFNPVPSDSITGVDQLQSFLDNLKIQLGISVAGTTDTSAIRDQIKAELTKAFSAFAGSILDSLIDSIVNGLTIPGAPAAPSDITFPDLTKLLVALDGMLKEKYRFDVFAPASVNYGLLLNYRQHWQPQSYQVGNLVSTIPLAPQETRRYTSKMVVKRTRNVKEIDNSVRDSKRDSNDTWRIDADIVDRAKNQTNFQKNASGSFGNDNLYKVSAGLQQGQDQAVESAQTKRDFHEAVVKASQDYRSEHRMEITTEESTESETTTFQEIRNPNDELTVTYLFYELQRRYLVDEALHKATPVILVANEVPAPHEVDQSWVLRHDWIIKRTILDSSFLPALEYLSTNYAGEELTLQVLGLSVQQQKAIVDKISQQVAVANQALDTATIGLQNTETQDIQDLKAAEQRAFVKSFFDPLGITQAGGSGDGNTDRAKIDFAKDELNRAQAKANQLTSDLKSETTALQMAIDKYTAAATRHFSMLADIDRLRLHVKDNIIYYMQAIWTYEPADQRYFRLYYYDVPVFGHNTTVKAAQKSGLSEIDITRSTIAVAFPPPTLLDEPMKLHQVADLESLIGFKGNYMIFPMTNFNYMTWFMMQNYIHLDDTTGVTAQDADPLAGVTIDQLKQVMATTYARDPASFNQPFFEEIMYRLLSTQNPEMVIVPSNSLYIEALPGTHPLLEDFKLIHRAIDVKRAQAEARKAELENLRLASRLSTGMFGDPDVDKVVVVEDGKGVTVDAGP